MTTYIGTTRGAVGFMKMTADTANGAVMPSQVHLRDGIAIRPDITGALNVRSSDVQPLLSTGLVLAGVSSQAAFQAGIIAGTGVGTAT